MFRAGAPDPVQSLISLLTSLYKSGLGPLARHGNHQEIINKRFEQMYTSSDTRLEWSGGGPLFESDSNKGRGPKRGHYLSHLLGHY